MTHDKTIGANELELYFSASADGMKMKAWKQGRADYRAGLTNPEQFYIRDLRNAYAQGWLRAQKEDNES